MGLLGQFLKLISVMIISLLVLILSCIAIIFFGLKDFCGPYGTAEEYLSPSNQTKAIHFYRTCGAFDGSNPAVSILDESIDTSDLAAIKRLLKQSEVFECYRCEVVDVRWISPERIEIRFSPPVYTGYTFESAEDYVRNSRGQYGNVSIRFVEVKP